MTARPPAVSLRAMTEPPRDLRLTTFELAGVAVQVVSYPLPASVALAPLTPAQRAVAELALAGLSNREIAERRGTSEATVAKHLEQAYRRLGVGTRTELAALVLDEAGAEPPTGTATR
ncbi:MAG: helix-turn-helix transcriptional regulator [Myxococcota bacterium]